MNKQNKNLSKKDKIINSQDSHPNKSFCNNRNFSCPSEISASVEDNLFCTPLKCPEKVPVKRFSSPNTQLSPKEFEKQKQCIEQINSLLNTLTSPRDSNNLSALRMHFRMLSGILVEVEFDCNDSKESIKGLLKDAGRDFLEIEDIGKKYFIPYQQICALNSNDYNSSKNHGHTKLEDIDECLRRDIVLNFGEVVSENPNLINIFFGIPLHLQLVQFIGCKTLARIEGRPNVVEGILIKSKKDKIYIKISDKNIEEINIIHVCNIAI